MQSVRGMHDILPGEIKYWQYIYNVALKILETASYQEVRTPLLESTSLFLRTIGQDTDIVNKEMYNFVDQGKRNLTLKPEGTASIARAIVQHKLCEKQAIQKLWYLGPMFRYERPQQGRQRQFHQLGLECYGSKNPVVDAEIIHLAQTMLHSLSCKNFTVEINSIGNSEERAIYANKLREYLKKYETDIDIDSRRKLESNPLKILDSKNPSVKEILYDAPDIQNFLKHESQQHFELVQEYLNSLDIKFEVNTKLVRGLDYYNDTVFEIRSAELGNQGTICGGGRYDNLTEYLGGKNIPAIGWGIGVERLLLLVKNKLLISCQHLCFYVATQNTKNIGYSLQLVPLMQKFGLKYELDISGSMLRKQIQKASKRKAMICIIIGQEEVNNKTITLKWLDKNYQNTYKIEKLQNMLPKIYKEYVDFNKNYTSQLSEVASS
uniref:Histidine-tRNA ligase n=1 Tax=Nemalion vermiculare TaxID=935621 RepID=UPI00257C98D1|nr:Histidine-tRNA ligase [Nemalion vermiculare]WGV34328.1 Histidine-tRNA ligase [Nemalion vermiculare]